MSETEPRTPLLEFEADAALETAREAVAEGQCVVFLTDTVYRIGCAASDTRVVTGLLEVKKRGRGMLPPVLIAEASVLCALTGQAPKAIRKLAARFWPGALAIIVRARRSLPLDLGKTRGVVAVRILGHGQAHTLLRRMEPMAANSANVSKQPAVTTTGEAHRILAEAVTAYLDGGRAPRGKAFTTIDLTGGEHGRILYQGAVGLEELHEVVPELQAG